MRHLRHNRPILLAALWAGLMAGVAFGQPPAENPVYVDDAPLAEEAMALLPTLLESANHAEAIRVLQRMLDESGSRLIPIAGDAEQFTSVRARVHATLLRDAELLERYRQTQNPLAQRMLSEGSYEGVERTRLLTTSGLEAALRVAQRLLERGDFEGARLVATQLLEHPDREARADDVGELLTTIARYLDREAVWRLAEEARGGAIERTPIEPPAIVVEPRRTPMAQVEAVDLDEMVSSPLHSTDLPGLMSDPGDGGINFDAFSPWAMPLVTADELIVNDGGAITSWDRFTFERRWSARPPGYEYPNRIPGYRPGRRGRSELQMQDVSTVDARGDLVAGITGWVVTYGRGGVAQRHGDPRLHVIERDSGEVLWSWWPVLHDLDMAQAILVGRPVFVGDLVLVQARKQVAARRSLGTYLYALDARTGEVEWSRLVGSSGSLPYQSQAGLISPDLLVHEGVAYISSEIGVIAAIEAWSGRFIWARVRAGATLGGYDPAPAHALCPPVMGAESLFVLTADRTDVLRMDPEDGAILGERSADRLGRPRYLLAADGMLAAVGDDQLTVTPMENFESATVRLVLYPASQQPVGRVVSAGDRLLAPVEGGLYEIVARDPERTRLLSLRASGLVTPTNGQLVVTDSSAVHGYLVWTTAERVLSERMEADPDDPTPAMTFAQLSVQAGRPERLVEALERALAAIERQGSGDLAGAYRDRLFELILAMVREESFELAMVDELIALLEASADAPAQRVAQLIELGAHRDRQGRARDAIDAYQRILLDDELGSATWPGPRLSVRADLEAARRLRGVLARNGHDLYRRYETLARSELRALGADASPAALEQFARRYPASGAATEAWLGAADRYGAQGQGHQAVRALRLGLQSGSPEASARAELSGRLIRALIEQERWGEVAGALRTLGDDASPTSRGLAIDLAIIRRTVERQLRERRAVASVGAPDGEGLIFVESWTLARPALESEWTHIGYAGIEQRRDDRVRVGALEAGGTIRWQRDLAPGGRIVRADPHAMLVLENIDDATRITRLDANSGEILWTSEPLDLRHASDEIEFSTPMDGPVRASELIAVGDAHTLILGTRGGRAVGIDLEDGRELWTSQLPIRRVHDMAIGAGIVAVGGAVEPADATWPFLDASTPMIAALDARSGQAMYTTLGEAGGIQSEIRWLRVAMGGRVVAGVGDGVLSADPLAGELAWLNDEQALRGSLDAWIVDGAGGRVLVLSATRDLWSVSLETGRTDPAPMPTRSTTYTKSRIEVAALDGMPDDGRRGGLVISSARGAVVLDADDVVVGADAIPAQDTLVPAVVGSGAILTIDTAATPSGREYPLYALDFTGKLISKPIGVVLNQAIGPEAIGLLDGEVLISTGAGIVVVPAP